MARRKRNESPERQALREMLSGYLKDNPVTFYFEFYVLPIYCTSTTSTKINLMGYDITPLIIYGFKKINIMFVIRSFLRFTDS